MPKERRIPLCLSVPESLYNAVIRTSIKDNTSISLAGVGQLAKSYGVNPKVYAEGSRKKRNYEQSLTPALQLQHTNEPWPLSLGDFSRAPYRPKTLYKMFLDPKLFKRWGVHDPNKTCPAECPNLDDDKNHPLITSEQRATLRDIMEAYGYEY